jgi:hypothetical protein
MLIHVRTVGLQRSFKVIDPLLCGGLDRCLVHGLQHADLRRVFFALRTLARLTTTSCWP